ncbi:5-methyltetrahydropteroyltriglutamate--homocysteine S-methyltransferase [Kineococcus glutinatus]|uniref:5-methyltetrahydropteroyltriglutamate--homocysteine S-methyltransferase n=1 Tax=Kineococcus glutinatus TaxID=1070872 RepID=A0ABP9I5J3_9ACTN
MSTDAPATDLRTLRADHVGSLLRPAAVREARAARARGELTDEQVRAVEDEAVRDVVRRQEEAGLRVATDGELRRDYWHLDFVFSLPGVEPGPEVRVPFHTPEGEVVWWGEPSRRITGPVRLQDTVFGRDIAAVRQAVTTAAPKLSIPSVNHVHSAVTPADVTGSGYADVAAALADVQAAYREQVRRLAQDGLTYLQVDDVSLAILDDPAIRGRLEEAGSSVAEVAAQHVDSVNATLAGRPEHLVVGTHLCRGNFRSSWAATGGYEAVAEQLFGRLDVDRYFLEYDDSRSGGFEPLRFLPPGKTAVLGIVTSKSAALEDKDDLKRRIDEAARFAPLEQLAISPQCGFASTAEGNALTEEEQWAKLRLVVEVAEEVWG